MIRYPVEVLSEDIDDGTMVDNVETLASAVIGHRIVSVEEKVSPPEDSGYGAGSYDKALRLTLDDGSQVYLTDTDDCCAFTDLEEVVKHLDKIDHVILGVGTTGDYTRWHIYADLGDVLELQVGWSPGNAFYYGYGFHIHVTEPTMPTPDEEADTLASIVEAHQNLRGDNQ